MNNTRKGQVAVEFALILVVLVALVFGILEVSRLVFISSEIENGAREGAQYAALHTGVTEAALVPIVQSKLTLADRNAITVDAIDLVYPQTGQRCVYCQVRVSVTYQWTPLVRIVGLGAVNLQSSSTKFVEVP